MLPPKPSSDPTRADSASGRAHGGPRAAIHRFTAIGAPWRIDTPEPLEPAVVGAIEERIERFDRTYSRFRADSLVSRIAREPGVWEFPADAPPLFDLYRELYEATGGAVSPLVGRRLENLGYDRTYSLTPERTSVRVPTWDNAVAWDGHALTTVRPVVLDVGAAGKGYLVDLVAAILDDAGITDYVVDASGDIVHRGTIPLRVALEHPRDPTKAIGVVALANGALCASASNRRAWGPGLHHILDATTGEPTRSVIATWAIIAAAEPLPTMRADGLATALFFRDAGAFRDAAAFPDTAAFPDAGAPTSSTFQHVRMFADGTVDSSPNLSGDLFR
jgi:thiamine biosynthesis lipoprotein